MPDMLSVSGLDEVRELELADDIEPQPGATLVPNDPRHEAMDMRLDCCSVELGLQLLPLTELGRWERTAELGCKGTTLLPLLQLLLLMVRLDDTGLRFAPLLMADMDDIKVNGVVAGPCHSVPQ